jgi:hypothetical protein
MLNTLGYLDYGPDNEIRKDKAYDYKIYWWQNAIKRRLSVNLNNIYPNRDPGEDNDKMKHIAKQFTAIEVGKRQFIEKVKFFKEETPGIYLMELRINKEIREQFLQMKYPDLSRYTITIDGKPYPLNHYFEYSINEGQHSTSDGVIYFKGPDIKPGNNLKTIGLLDVTPAILKILDLPVGKDMAGTVPVGIFKQEFLASHPIRYIKSYDEINKPLPQNQIRKSPLDDKVKRQLRALGYIQ